MSTVDPSEIPVMIRGIFLQQYTEVAVFSALIFDTLITIDKETKYFWTRFRYSLMHILFFVNRYIGILSVLARVFIQSLEATTRLCRFSQYTQVIGGILVTVITDYVLMIRVLALWHNNKKLSRLLYITIFCEATSMFTFGIMGLTMQGPQSFVLGGGIKVCGFEGSEAQAVLSQTLQVASWTVTATVGFFLLVLALHKAVEHRRLSGVNGSSLLSTMVKDQIIYYVMVLFCSIMNIVVFRARSDGNINTVAVFDLFGNPGLLCILSNRMFLNLKEAAGLQACDGTVHLSRGKPVITVSLPRFDERSDSSGT